MCAEKVAGWSWIMCVLLLLPLAARAQPEATPAPQAHALWSKNCRSCHGWQGTSQTSVGKALNARSFRDATWQREATDERILGSIKNGVADASGRKKMPAFGTKLSHAELKVLLQVVRAFGSDQAPFPRESDPELLPVGVPNAVHSSGQTSP